MAAPTEPHAPQAPGSDIVGWTMSDESPAKGRKGSDDTPDETPEHAADEREAVERAARQLRELAESDDSYGLAILEDADRLVAERAAAEEAAHQSAADRAAADRAAAGEAARESAERTSAEHSTRRAAEQVERLAEAERFAAEREAAHAAARAVAERRAAREAQGRPVAGKTVEQSEADDRSASSVVTFRPRGNLRLVAGVLEIAVLAAAAWAAYAVYREASTNNIVLAVILGALLIGVHAVRSSSSPAQITIDRGALDVVHQQSHHRFDLTNEHIDIEVQGEPGERGWRFLVHRRSLAPFQIDRSMVDPEEFMRVVRRHRPGL